MGYLEGIPYKSRMAIMGYPEGIPYRMTVWPLGVPEGDTLMDTSIGIIGVPKYI